MYLGLDLGATHLRVMVADHDDVQGRVRTATPRGEAITQAIRAAIQEACDRSGIDPAAIGTAGIATVGPLEDGQLRTPANLHGADGVELRSVVAGEVGEADFALVNDATAAAVAEAEASDVGHLAYLTLSTGIGAGVVAEDRPLIGYQGNAGEVGHVVLEPETDLECGCGGVGHWEALCGGANLAAHARAIAAEGVQTNIALDQATPETLLSNADADPVASALVDRLGRYNTRGTALLVAAYDPARLVVGGGLMRNHPEKLLEPIRSGLRERCLREPPPVELAHHGDEAAVRGAVTLAQRRDRNR